MYMEQRDLGGREVTLSWRNISVYISHVAEDYAFFSLLLAPTIVCRNLPAQTQNKTNIFRHSKTKVYTKIITYSLKWD